MRISIGTIVKSVFLVALLAVVGVGGYVAYNRLPSLIDELSPRSRGPQAPPGQEVFVEIPKGATLSQVATILENKGVISSRLVFKLVAMIRGEQRKIKAGEYALKTGSDAGHVLDQLISGKTLVFYFTVPEGYTIYEVADLFQQWGMMSRQEFLATVRDKAFIKELGVDADSLEG